VRGAPVATSVGLHVREWLAANGVDPSAVLDIGATPNALMGQLVREADVALFPNRCEGGTNLVAMECMASGVPTILSANTGHLDLIALGGCVPLVEQRAVPAPVHGFRETAGWGESDVEEMVEALERVYQDRAAAQALAREGAERLAAHSWERQIERLLDALAPIL
jgi:glycosyltransferase involved in cell wall biosynthesis